MTDATRLACALLADATTQLAVEQAYAARRAAGEAAELERLQRRRRRRQDIGDIAGTAFQSVVMAGGGLLAGVVAGFIWSIFAAIIDMDDNLHGAILVIIIVGTPIVGAAIPLVNYVRERERRSR